LASPHLPSGGPYVYRDSSPAPVAFEIEPDPSTRHNRRHNSTIAANDTNTDLGRFLVELNDRNAVVVMK